MKMIPVDDLFLSSTKNHASSTSPREMGKESREHWFQLIYRSDGTWRIHQLNTSYIAKNAEMSCKTPVTTCVTAFWRFAKPLQRYPLMVNKYLLSKHTIGTRKNPPKYRKNTKI